MNRWSNSKPTLFKEQPAGKQAACHSPSPPTTSSYPILNDGRDRCLFWNANRRNAQQHRCGALLLQTRGAMNPPACSTPSSWRHHLDRQRHRGGTTGGPACRPASRRLSQDRRRADPHVLCNHRHGVFPITSTWRRPRLSSAAARSRADASKSTRCERRSPDFLARIWAAAPTPSWRRHNFSGGEHAVRTSTRSPR